MDAEAVIAAFWEEGRTLVWPGETRDARPLVTRRMSEPDGPCLVTAHRLDETNADAAIREEAAHFAALGRPFEWKAYSFDRPVDLVRRLERAGFDVENREAILVYDLKDGLASFALDADVRRVERVKDLADFRLVAEAAFGRDYGVTTDQLETLSRRAKGDTTPTSPISTECPPPSGGSTPTRGAPSPACSAAAPGPGSVDGTSTGRPSPHGRRRRPL